MTDIPAQHSDTEQPSPYKGYKKIANPFFAMLLLFGLPYAISWYFLYGGDPIAFEKPNNHGVLVSPVVALGKLSLIQQNGSTLSHEDLAGNWSLITVTKSCDKACQETLFNIRQVRKAMGVNRQVIQPIVLLENPSALAPLTINLAQEFPQLAIIAQQNDTTEKLTQLFSNTTSVIENTIFMVDPYGNLMMVYPAGSGHKGLLKDLQRLLKVNKPNL